jgi:hypothetical protein
MEGGAMSECWIYHMYSTKSDDDDGELLYVGISDSPSSRMGNHESQKWWWWLVDSVSWHKCYSREEAESFETKSIKANRPLFNRSESDLDGWDRLSSIVYLLWSHRENPHSHTVCPFCDSHGEEVMLSQQGCCKLFRRNCDDQLVIHFETCCDLHGRKIEWAVHVPALIFLRDFGRMPESEVVRLYTEGCRGADWENRLDRMATLYEMVSGGLPLLASDICIEAAGSAR